MINQTTSLFEISYWAMNHITSWMSASYELKNRIKSQDSRRMMFENQLELLSVIGINYKKRRENEIDEILKYAPYQDDLV